MRRSEIRQKNFFNKITRIKIGNLWQKSFGLAMLHDINLVLKRLLGQFQISWGAGTSDDKNGPQRQHSSACSSEYDDVVNSSIF